MEYIDKYLEVLETQDEFVKLDEVDLSKLVSILTPESKTKSLIKKVQSSLDKKDPIKSLKRIKSLMSFMPKVNIRKIDNYLGSKLKDYKGLKKMADIIVGNSLPNISNPTKDYATSFLALSSFIAKKGSKITPKDNLKKNVKEFVMRSRKFIDDYEDDEKGKKAKKTGFQKEDLPDLAVAWVVVVMSTVFGVSLGSGLYAILVSFAATVPYFMATIFIVALIWGIIVVEAG